MFGLCALTRTPVDAQTLSYEYMCLSDHGCIRSPNRLSVSADVSNTPLLWVYLAVRLSSIYIVLFLRLPMKLLQCFFSKGGPDDALVS